MDVGRAGEELRRVRHERLGHLAREMGLPAQGLLLSLFGFNAGVELGQALVVAVALSALRP